MAQQEQPAYDAVMASLWRRLAQLRKEDHEEPPPPLARELASLCRECNRQTRGRDMLDERLPASLGHSRRRIRQLLDRVGELEKERFEPPLTGTDKKAFKAGLTKLRRSGRTFETIADMRYTGKWGQLGGAEETRSRRLIEVNRFLTERPNTRDRRYARWAICIALVMGFVATLAATLAVPADKTGPLRCAIPIVMRMLCAEAPAAAADVLD